MDSNRDMVRVATVVQPKNSRGREPQLGVEKQKHPVLAEIDKRAVSWLLPPVMSHHHAMFSDVHIGEGVDGGWRRQREGARARKIAAAQQQ